MGGQSILRGYTAGASRRVNGSAGQLFLTLQPECGAPLIFTGVTSLGAPVVYYVKERADLGLSKDSVYGGILYPKE